MTYFPIFIKLEGRHFLFVGGGEVAERKIKKLLSFSDGVKITIISPEITESLRELWDKKKVDWIKSSYSKEILKAVGDFDFCIAATNSGDVNKYVEEDIVDLKKFFMRVDDGYLSDFHFPAVIKKDHYLIAIYSGGIDPYGAKRLKERLEEIFEKSS